MCLSVCLVAPHALPDELTKRAVPEGHDLSAQVLEGAAPADRFPACVVYTLWSHTGCGCGWNAGAGETDNARRATLLAREWLRDLLDAVPRGARLLALWAGDEHERPAERSIERHELWSLGFQFEDPVLYVLDDVPAAT